MVGSSPSREPGTPEKSRSLSAGKVSIALPISGSKLPLPPPTYMGLESQGVAAAAGLDFKACGAGAPFAGLPFPSGKLGLPPNGVPTLPITSSNGLAGIPPPQVECITGIAEYMSMI